VKEKEGSPETITKEKPGGMATLMTFPGENIIRHLTSKKKERDANVDKLYLTTYL
jgi:hypothetical protein